jgi:hypothetical protein
MPRSWSAVGANAWRREPYDFERDATARPVVAVVTDPVEPLQRRRRDQGLGSRRLSVPVDHDIAVEDTGAL